MLLPFWILVYPLLTAYAMIAVQNAHVTCPVQIVPSPFKGGSCVEEHDLHGQISCLKSE